MKIQEALNNAIFNIGIRLQNKLREKSPVDTGDLRRSITVTVTDKGLNISMLKQGRFTEWGSNPHPVSPEHLKDWARRVLGDEQAAYAVANKIKKHGTRPSPFIRPTFNNEFKDIVEEEIKKALKKSQ